MLRRKVPAWGRSGGCCWWLSTAQGGVGNERSGLETWACLDRAPSCCLTGRLQERSETQVPQQGSVWGQGLLQERSGTPVEPVSLQPLHSPELEPAGSTGSKRLLAPTARSTESLTPAECHKSQILPRPVLFTPFPGAESQVGKMLWTPSWVICVPHAGSQSMFLGPPPSLPPLSHRGQCPSGAIQGQVSVGRFPALCWTGCQARGPKVKELPGKWVCLCPGCFEETSAWDRPCPSVINNHLITPA